MQFRDTKAFVNTAALFQRFKPGHMYIGNRIYVHCRQIKDHNFHPSLPVFNLEDNLFKHFLGFFLSSHFSYFDFLTPYIC